MLKCTLKITPRLLQAHAYTHTHTHTHTHTRTMSALKPKSTYQTDANRTLPQKMFLNQLMSNALVPLRADSIAAVIDAPTLMSTRALARAGANRVLVINHTKTREEADAMTTAVAKLNAAYTFYNKDASDVLREVRSKVRTRGSNHKSMEYTQYILGGWVHAQVMGRLTHLNYDGMSCARMLIDVGVIEGYLAAAPHDCPGIAAFTVTARTGAKPRSPGTHHANPDLQALFNHIASAGRTRDLDVSALLAYKYTSAGGSKMRVLIVLVQHAHKPGTAHAKRVADERARLQRRAIQLAVAHNIAFVTKRDRIEIADVETLPTDYAVAYAVSEDTEDTDDEDNDKDDEDHDSVTTLTSTSTSIFASEPEADAEADAEPMHMQIARITDILRVDNHEGKLSALVRWSPTYEPLSSFADCDAHTRESAHSVIARAQRTHARTRADANGDADADADADADDGGGAKEDGDLSCVRLLVSAAHSKYDVFDRISGACYDAARNAWVLKTHWEPTWVAVADLLQGACGTRSSCVCVSDSDCGGTECDDANARARVRARLAQCIRKLYQTIAQRSTARIADSVFVSASPARAFAQSVLLPITTTPLKHAALPRACVVQVKRHVLRHMQPQQSEHKHEPLEPASLCGTKRRR